MPPKILADENCPTCDGAGCDDCATVTEGAEFDKFMDRILSEEHPKGMAVLVDSPQRIRAARNQERPLGRIRMNGGR